MDENILFVQAQKIEELKKIPENERDNHINETLKIGENAINDLMKLKKKFSFKNI